MFVFALHARDIFCIYVHTFPSPCTLTAVKSIKKQHLAEIRAMPTPPPLVKLALEAICMMLGKPDTDWKGIRSIIMGDNFISSIVNFRTDDIT